MKGRAAPLMRYVILDRDGKPLSDLVTHQPIIFATRDEARRFVMAGERVAAWLEGGRKIVPLTR